MNYFANLQAPQIKNALLDFSPVNNALSEVRDQNNVNRNALMRQEEQTYQRGRDAKQDARVEQGDRLKLAETLARRADAVGRLPPEQRGPAWQRHLMEHKRYFPDDAIDPEDMDPNTGPMRYAAAFGGVSRDPRDDKAKDLDIEYKQAQIQKLQREPAGGEAPSNVREYQYFQSLPPEQQQQYLTMKRAEKFIDNGTSFIQPNPVAPGQNIRVIPKDLAGAERAKAVGEMQGKQESSAPSDIAAADQALTLLKDIKDDPNMGVGTGFTSYGNVVRGTPGFDFQNKVNQATSGAFLTAIQQMRGLGALSNAEGQTATLAVTRMNTATSEDAFKKALTDYETIVTQGRERAAARLKAPDEQTTTGGGGDDPLAEARDAIARGASRDAVIQRLNKLGINPAGL